MMSNRELGQSNHACTPVQQLAGHEQLKTPFEASFLDTAVEDMARQYWIEAGLVNGEAYNYKQLSLNHKADTACLVWGNKPETWERSITLKGLVFARRILHAGQEDQREMWENKKDEYRPYSKSLPYADFAYYSKVDRLIFDNLGRVMLENTGICKPLEAAEFDQFGLPNGPFAAVKDNVIHRQLSIRPDGHPNMALYAVYPTDYPARVIIGGAVII